MLAETNRKLGALDAFSMHVPDTDIFIEMHVAKETIKSSRIEGTRTEIDEALKKSSDVTPERKNDWLEVHNYFEAKNSTINKLKTLLISTGLLKSAHNILIYGVRESIKIQGNSEPVRIGLEMQH